MERTARKTADSSIVVEGGRLAAENGVTGVSGIGCRAVSLAWVTGSFSEASGALVRERMARPYCASDANRIALPMRRLFGGLT